MAKFEKNEVAIVIIDPRYVNRFGTRSECTIVEIGPFKAGESHPLAGYFNQPADYLIRMPDGGIYSCDEPYLRKRRPPEKPAAFTYQEIIDMCNDKTITSHVTESDMRKTMENLYSFTAEDGHGS